MKKTQKELRTNNTIVYEEKTKLEAYHLYLKSTRNQYKNRERAIDTSRVTKEQAVVIEYENCGSRELKGGG